MSAGWGSSSRSGVRSGSRAYESDRSQGSVSWQSRVNDSARNSGDGERGNRDRDGDSASPKDDSASHKYDGKGDDRSVTKPDKPLGRPLGRRVTTGTTRDELRDRKPFGRPSASSRAPIEKSNTAVVVSKNFVVFVAAGLTFFGLSVLGAGRSNKQFERHFQEIAKVRTDRRRLREENEALALENAKLRARVGGGSYSSKGAGSYGNASSYDGSYQPSLVQEVSEVNSTNGYTTYGFQG
jgi:hypothetical protein